MSKQSKIPAAELAIFCQEPYQLVQSSLPIADGLNMLLEDETDRRTKAWLAPLCAHAEEGMPLAQAMRQTEAFPDYMTDMVALAEQTGRLQDVLPALSAHYTRQDRMIDDVRRAFAVPIALFCVMLAVVFLLITQVLPVFSRVFAQIGVQMSPVAARLMHIGQVLSGAGLGIAIVLGVVAVLALVVLLVPAQRARVTGFVRFHLGGARCVWPDCGSTFRVCDVDGGSTAQALSESGLFSARDGRLLALSERTGSMAETLEQVADTLRRIDGYIGAIEPTIVILTALLAGVILLSVMLPLMSVISTIG